MNQVRVVFAWVLGIVVWFAVGHLLTLVGDGLGVPSSIQHDPPLLDENDMLVFSSWTLFGYAQGLFACLVGAWAGQAKFHRSWRAGFTTTGAQTFVAWLAGSVVVAILGGLTHLALPRPHGSWAWYGRMLTEFAIVAGVAYACWRWRLARAR